MEIQAIHNQYRTAILIYLSGLTGNLAEAEDLTQEVFIKIDKSLETYRGDSKLSTWIYKIANNIAIDRIRSASYRKIQKKTDSISLLDNEKENTSILIDNNEPSLEQKIVRGEMNGCIQNYINQLNKNYKMVILLCDYQGLKNNEAAEVLGVSLATVKIRLHRARTKLKKMMDSGCNIYNSDKGELGCNEK